MNSKKSELKKYVKNSSIEQNLNDKKIGMDLNTSFEDLQQGQFPEKLLEEMNILKNSSNLEIIKEIEVKHAEILEKRPLPELLETANLIDNLKEVKKPVMGKLYDEKRQANLEKELQSKSEE
tara:strand:- start:34 stop:399 length:366 start_codon:yes stop_codon:yes gene_type:complete